MLLKLLRINFLRKYYILICFALFRNELYAQWQSIGNFDQGASAFYEDSANYVFYIGGTFHFYNNDTVVGIGEWNGTNLLPMNCGLGWDCVHISEGLSIGVPNEVISYKDKLFVVGSFRYADN